MKNKNSQIIYCYGYEGQVNNQDVWAIYADDICDLCVTATKPTAQGTFFLIANNK